MSNFYEDFKSLSLQGIVVNGDCFQLFKSIPNNSIDAIITDPPYFLDGMGESWKADMTGRKTTAKQTVSSLRAGMKFDRKQSYQFQEFMERVAEEGFRVLKPGGWFVSFSAPRLYHRLGVAVEDAGFEIRDMWQWLYTQNQVKAMSIRRSMASDTTLSGLSEEELKTLQEELEIWKTPQVKSCFEPIVMAQKPRIGNFYQNWREHRIGLINISTEVENSDGETKVTANVKTTEELTDQLDQAFLIGKPTKKEKGDTTHLSVKPLTLMKHLAKVLVPENGVIIDPFSGSGSTGIGAIEESRKYIGFEQNNNYFAQSIKRFENISSCFMNVDQVLYISDDKKQTSSLLKSIDNTPPMITEKKSLFDI